jgi:hypothetical protein
MPIQELSYLRDEINQRLNFAYEHAGKTTRHMWIVWSITFVLLGVIPNFLSKEINVILVAIITILTPFISNLFLYSTSIKDRENLERISDISSYITIFHEWKIGKGRKDHHSSWEIALFERDTASNQKSTKTKPRSFNIMHKEYTIMAAGSTFIILILSLYYEIFIFLEQNQNQFKLLIGITIFEAVSLVALGISALLIPKISKNTSLKCMIDEKKEKLCFFLNYAIDNGYYSMDDVFKRFSIDFLEEIGYAKQIFPRSQLLAGAR